MLQCLRTTSALLAGAHSYFVVSWLTPQPSQRNKIKWSFDALRSFFENFEEMVATWTKKKSSECFGTVNGYHWDWTLCRLRSGGRKMIYWLTGYLTTGLLQVAQPRVLGGFAFYFRDASITIHYVLSYDADARYAGVITPSCSVTDLIVQDPRATRPQLFSDGQNMYNRLVLVCAVNVYIPTSLGLWLILRYQVLQAP